MTSEDRKRIARRMTKHHVLPRSRGGNGNGNIHKLSQRHHEAWHVLFGNLTPNEAIHFIRVVFYGKGLKEKKTKWKPKELYALQLQIQMKSVEREQNKHKKHVIKK